MNGCSENDIKESYKGHEKSKKQRIPPAVLRKNYFLQTMRQKIFYSKKVKLRSGNWSFACRHQLVQEDYKHLRRNTFVNPRKECSTIHHEEENEEALVFGRWTSSERWESANITFVMFKYWETEAHHRENRWLSKDMHKRPNDPARTCTSDQCNQCK